MDEKELVLYLLTPVAQVALIIGIAEIVKRLGLPTRFIPLVDLALGLLSGICVYVLSKGYEWVSGIMIGLAIGLSACGLFSGIKNLTGKEKVDDESDS